MQLTASLWRWSAFALLTALPVFADAIPYPNIGTLAPTNTFTAAATGTIQGYFYGFSAADTDEIRMCNLTQNYCSPYTFQNQTTPVGASFNFGAVTAGDLLGKCQNWRLAMRSGLEAWYSELPSLVHDLSALLLSSNFPAERHHRFGLPRFSLSRLSAQV